jgi:hypothetical protein
MSFTFLCSLVVPHPVTSDKAAAKQTNKPN